MISYLKRAMPGLQTDPKPTPDQYCGRYLRFSSLKNKTINSTVSATQVTDKETK